MEDGKVFGMITDRDLVVRGLVRSENPGRLSVDQIMTREVFSCTEEDTMEDAARIMVNNQVRRLVVRNSTKFKDTYQKTNYHPCTDLLR